MDAAGKDGAIKHVMSGVNPQGCQVFSYSHPSPAELQHDFLWRTTRDLPQRGRIGIFNRSYYEEVLIVRVHPEILRGEGLPDTLLDQKTVWRDRYRSIVHLEKHLHNNGTRIIKFYLHLSKEEQRKRFLQRANNDQKVGIEIVRKAIQSPVRQIAENSGTDGSVVVGKLTDRMTQISAMTHRRAITRTWWRPGLSIRPRSCG
jgi:hypothetical protein